MKRNARYYFPGNNTPGGFFSYYHHILNQNEGGKVWCLKGGPGTGKSTFVKKVGENLLKKGYEVDFLVCSSDCESFDGIKVKNFRLAIIDATPPHSVDPIYPGALDMIVDLGRYWDEEGIRKNSREIINTRKAISEFYKKAYNYLGAAEKIYDILALGDNREIAKTTAFKISENILKDCLIKKAPLKKESDVRQFFASAITPQGVVNHLESIIQGCGKVYVLRSEVGWNSQIILGYFSEALIGMGYDVELFYCPMKAKSKIEHIVVPELSLAVISSNEYHEFPLNSLESQKGRELIDVELIRKRKGILDKDEADCRHQMADHIDWAIACLGEAKRLHDKLEEFYIPNMDFEALLKLRTRIEDEILDLLQSKAGP